VGGDGRCALEPPRRTVAANGDDEDVTRRDELANERILREELAARARVERRRLDRRVQGEDVEPAPLRLRVEPVGDVELHARWLQHLLVPIERRRKVLKPHFVVERAERDVSRAHRLDTATRGRNSVPAEHESPARKTHAREPSRRK
jgi:hypothetical protein